MGAIAAPIVPGKVDAWKAWRDELNGPRKAELEDCNARFGLTRHRAWLQQNPDGSHLVIAVVDGPGGDSFMEALAASDHPFDAWFKGKAAEIHGIDFSGPMPPPPELALDSGGP